MNAAKTLYLSDLDGTLLNKEARFTAKSIEILKRLLEKGLPFSIASARSNISMIPILKELPIKFPVITMNGTMLYDPVAGKLMDAACFPPGRARRILDLLREKNTSPFLYALDDMGEQRVYCANLDNPMIRAHYQTRTASGDPRYRNVPSLEPYVDGRTFYIMTLGPESDMRPASDHLNENGIVHHFYPDTYTGGYLLECSAPGADKGAAALRLKKTLGAERLVVFGDNLNDLSMFAAADESYAVADAHETLKEAATGVIGASCEDGVALFLEKDFSQTGSRTV